MDNEIPVKFSNEQNTLFGIVNNHNSDIGIILLHGWGTSRIGPSALIVKTARCFSKWGISSMRFDFGGRGFSTGKFNNTVLLDMIDDVESAIECFKKHTKVKKILLWGICSGGEVAVAVAAKNNNIYGTILLSTPLLGRQMLTSSLEQNISASSKNIKSYLRKIFLLQTYAKLFNGKLNFKIIFNILFGHWLNKKKCTDNELQLLNKFCNIKKPSLFIYGSCDPEYNQSFAEYSKRQGESPWEYVLIDGANHNFYSINWHKTILDKTKLWINDLKKHSIHE